MKFHFGNKKTETMEDGSCKVIPTIVDPSPIIKREDLIVNNKTKRNSTTNSKSKTKKEESDNDRLQAKSRKRKQKENPLKKRRKVAIEKDPKDYLLKIKDPITKEFMEKPAISPYGHVLEYSSWMNMLKKKPEICPFTNKKLTRRDLIKLTKENLKDFKDKIVIA